MRGGGAPGPALAEVYRVLSDGEWHDREEVIAAAMLLVPASKAIRRRRRDVEHLARKRGTTPLTRPISVEREMAIGRRRIASVGLKQAIGSGRIERDDNGRVRLKPK